MMSEQKAQHAGLLSLKSGYRSTYRFASIRLSRKS